MSPAAARSLFALYVLLCALCPLISASKPLQPRNVKLSKVDKGLQVTWDPPNQLDGRPVERYSIGYGKSMRSLRFITVGKDQRSEILEDVEPGVLHFLKMSAENEDGLSKPVYRAEVPGGPEFVKLDGFAVESSTPRNSSTGRFGGLLSSGQRSQRPLRAPQSSSGPRQPVRSPEQSEVPSVSSHRVDVSQPQADQHNKPNLASESVYVVSLQAQRGVGRSSPVNKALVNRKHTPEPTEVDEAEDLTVRVMSPQSVLITWLDPLIETKKAQEGSRQYTVRYREKGESARWEYKDATQRRVMVESLSADSMYEFSVRITDRHGNEGKWSTSVFQRTPESAPSGPPENFQVKPLRGKGTAVTATWDPPEEPNGRLREYILSYAPALKPFGAKSVTFRGSTTSATVDGLQPGERYIFKIRAINRRGQGPQTKAFSVAMPASTSAASSSHHSRTLDRNKLSMSALQMEGEEEDYDNEETTTVTEEPRRQMTTTTPAPPAGRRTRPLTQTRSYHSIFSSVRGSSSRSSGATRSRGRESERGREEDEEKPIEAPKKEEAVTANEATEDEEGEEKRRNTDLDPYSHRTPSKLGEHQDQVSHGRKIPSKLREHMDYSKPSVHRSTAASETPSRELKSRQPVHSSSSQSQPSPDKTSGQPKRPLTRNPVIRSRVRIGGSSSSSSSRTSPSNPASGDSRRDSSSSRSGYLDKDTYTRDTPTRSTPKETRPEVDTSSSSSSSSLPSTSAPTSSDSSSDSSSSSSSSSPSSGSRQSGSSKSPTTGRFTGSGSVMINGRKVTLLSRWSRIMNGQRTPSSGSTSTSTSSGSQSGSQAQKQNQNPSPDKVSSPSQPSIQDTINPQDSNPSTQRQTTKDEEPTSSYETNRSHSSAVKKDNTERARGRTEEEEEEKQKEEEENEQESSSHSSTRQSPSLNHSLSSRGATLEPPSRDAKPGIVHRFPARNDGRIPWSRTSSSSVGNRRPVVRTYPSHSGVPETSERDDRTRTASSSYPSKHKVNDIPSKPSVLNRDRFSSGSRLPTSTTTYSRSPRQSSQTDNYHSDDYDYENYDNHDKMAKPTAALKTTTSTTTTTNIATKTTTTAPTTTTTTTASITTSTASPTQNSGDKSERRVHTTGRTGSQPVHPYARQPLQGSGGRTRSSVVASNRQNGSWFVGRLSPVQHTKLGSKPETSSPHLSSSSSSSSSPSQSFHVLPKPVLDSKHDVSRSSSQPVPGENSPDTSSSSQPSSPVVRSPVVSSRLRNPSRFDSILRGKTPVNGFKPSYGQAGKNGRPNLTTSNGKVTSLSTESKAGGRKYITGPDGAKWVVDLDKGLQMNHEGKVLQDSQGQPHRVVIGEDGRTVFDLQGTPLVNQDGLALFGKKRDSQPVVNPKEKMLTVGGKPLVGLDRPRARTSTTTTTTTATTTTLEPTTVPMTTEMTTEEMTEMTTELSPTCPPGTFFAMDEDGQPMLNDYGVLDCYPEDEFVMESTVRAITQTPTTTTTTTSPAPSPDTRPRNSGPSSEFDMAGKKRFTAPYVNYIRKDPGAPCSLTEALEFLQVDVLEGLLKKDSPATIHNLPPKNKPHNITVVAMEGCHSFVILDWDHPLPDDSVSGYLVHSASYDDVLNNRWSTSTSSATHLPVENLKPNSRYYFKIQAKNVFGLGPVSDTLVYVTESDDPLLIERPPGGEPIWIPYKFRYNPAHSSCKGSQFVKRTWYKKFVGVVLCNSLRYKIFMADGLKDTFYSLADSFGYGEDHCQFVDSYRDGRTGPHSLSMYLPPAQGYFRSYRQEPVTFGRIGRNTPHSFVGWYECGIPIPGKW